MKRVSFSIAALLLLATPALAAPPAAPAPAGEPPGPPPQAAPAPAEEHDEARIAEAKEKFLAGREALKQGDLVRALALFRRSQELYAAPGTLLNVANCEEQLGLIASAWQHFQALLALLPAGDDRRALAAAHAGELAPRVPRVTIRLAADAPRETVVTLDDVPLPPTSLGGEIPMDPGRHTLVATSPERLQRRYTLTVTEGQHLVTTVAPPHGRAFGDDEWGRVEDLSKLEKKIEAAPAPSRATQRTAGFVTGAVGLVSLGIGVASGAMAIVVNNQLKVMCPRPTACTRDGVAMEQIDRGLAGMSTATVVLGLAGLGAGITLVATGRDAPAPVITTTALAGGAALGLRGRF